MPHSFSFGAAQRRLLFAAVLASLATLATLSGCMSSNPLPPAFYSTSEEHQFPAVAVYLKRPGDKIAQDCSEASCFQDDAMMNAIYWQLRGSQTFAQVEPGTSGSADYALHISVHRFHTGNQAGEFAQTMVSAATLLLVPATVEYEYRTEIAVTWRKAKLAEYSYVTPMNQTLSLFNAPGEVTRRESYVAENVASRFIADAQGDGLFSSEKLYASLKAEDYRRDLKVPEQAGELRHFSTHIFPDPFAGVQLRFQPPSRHDAAYDAFVYPIRRTDWSDTSAALREEMETAGKDIALALKAGHFKQAEFGAPQPYQAQAGNPRSDGLRMEGQVQYEGSEPLRSQVYLFIKKDKFIKFRITEPAAAADDPQYRERFVAALMATLEVPDESLFMAELRQQARRAEIR